MYALCRRLERAFPFGNTPPLAPAPSYDMPAIGSFGTYAFSL